MYTHIYTYIHGYRIYTTWITYILIYINIYARIHPDTVYLFSKCDLPPLHRLVQSQQLHASRWEQGMQGGLTTDYSLFLPNLLYFHIQVVADLSNKHKCINCNLTFFSLRNRWTFIWQKQMERKLLDFTDCQGGPHKESSFALWGSVLPMRRLWRQLCHSERIFGSHANGPCRRWKSHQVRVQDSQLRVSNWKTRGACGPRALRPPQPGKRSLTDLFFIDSCRSICVTTVVAILWTRRSWPTTWPVTPRMGRSRKSPAQITIVPTVQGAFIVAIPKLEKW